jgi:hypothetical protein
MLALAAVALVLALPSPATDATVVRNLYRIDLTGGQTVWADEAPRPTGGLLLFHSHPGRILMSVRQSDVRRITVGAAPAPGRSLRPGAQIEIGPTGQGGKGGSSGAPAAGAAARGNGPLAPGEAKGGKALFNPDRDYRPEWDGRRVPGLNLAYPNSSNDYREGRSLAYPPASAVQSEPGAPPMMAPGTGEPPRGKQ